MIPNNGEKPKFCLNKSCVSFANTSLKKTQIRAGKYNWLEMIFHSLYDLQAEPANIFIHILVFTSIFYIVKQLEYTKKQGTENLHFAAIFKLRYIKKQDTKHLDSAIIFEISTCFWEIEIFVDNVEEN
ncbi:AP2/B3-like transcriptional factor family protein [Prunus dulcis]|uniref:AP2/B3-like transcriptional factor family protein n=1 Tax=Prunus dulcis TaxID=3755 RepID=A0A4Y1S0C3_PRUDU|nr:AP2/B3-like transcriptional factor family protein [Prunus dulcis]